VPVLAEDALIVVVHGQADATEAGVWIRPRQHPAVDLHGNRRVYTNELPFPRPSSSSFPRSAPNLRLTFSRARRSSTRRHRRELRDFATATQSHTPRHCFFSFSWCVPERGSFFSAACSRSFELNCLGCH